MVAEQCQVSEAADLTGPSKESSDLSMKILVAYSEQIISGEIDPSVLCAEHCNMNIGKREPCTFCNGHADSFEQHAASSVFFEPDQTLSEFDTWGLSQPFDEHALYCECLKTFKSPEHCANHSLASNCSPCREHCAGHFQLFRECKTSDQQMESYDFEPSELEVNRDSSCQCIMSDSIPGCTKHPELLQQNDPCESSDCEPDISTEDSKLSEMSASTHTSMVSPDFDSEHREYDKIPNNESVIDDEGGCENEDEPSDEESFRFLEVMPVDVDCEDVEYDPSVGDDCDAFAYAENDSMQFATGDTLADPNEFYETDTFKDDDESPETDSAEQCPSDSGSEFCAEEDCTSDYSSGETRSFQTGYDGSITSEPCSESSAESEKGNHEDSGDEQWESFEDEEETNKTKESNEDVNQKAVVDIVSEDYFDLFDRADTYNHVFAQKQCYISCFDGGDIHDRLHLEEAQMRNVENVSKFDDAVQENNAQGTNVCSEKAPDAYDENASQRDESRYSEDQSGSSSAGDEADSNESETQENSGEAEDDETCFDGEDCTFNDDVSQLCEEEREDYPSSASGDSMCAPFAKEISVEGDAYEDDVFSSANDKNKETEASWTDGEEPMEEAFIACSEMELYCSLLDVEELGELCDSGVEDYYSYHLINNQSFEKQALKDCVLGGKLYKQKINGKREKEVELQVTKIYPEKSATFQITKVIDLNSQTTELDDECGNENNSREIQLPSDIIHSVVSENNRVDAREVLAEGTEEDEAYRQSRDSDEEQSDDESDETCECEYCNPLTEQIPFEPLLPEVVSKASGKICVVIDLDETLVHSSFKPVNNADFIIPVEIDETVHQVYVLKRPHVDEFLKRMGEMFECVLFTASLSKYADPVADLLDKHGVFQSRLFRESCVFHRGNYVKDLSRLGRELQRVIIIDNSPASYVFHPENAVPVASWFDDMADSELLDLIPFFERLSRVDNVYELVRQQRSSS